MGIFPRLSLPVIRETFEGMSENASENVERFMLEQPVLTQSIRLVVSSDEEFIIRMSAMHFLYMALERQIKLG